MNLSPQKKVFIVLWIFFLVILGVFVFEFYKKSFIANTVIASGLSTEALAKVEAKQSPGAIKTTITFWQYWSGVEKKPLEELVKKFNSEDHDFKVKMVSISMPKKKILLSIVGKVPPDLVHLDGDMVSDFALRNALEPLDNFFDQEYLDRFIPVYIRMLNLQGSQFAMPLMPTCEALHINKNILDKYHLAEPSSLEDIVKIFDHINAHGDGREIAYLPSWPPWAGSFLPVVFGGEWGVKSNVIASPHSGRGNPPARNGLLRHSVPRNDEWQITAYSPENLEAWNWAVENFASKIDPQKLASYTEGFHAYQSPDNPFYSGKIALENNGVWEKNLAKIYSPQLNISVRAFPGRVPKATYVTVDALAIPKGAKHARQAAEFIKWLHKQENLEYLALAQQKFTPLNTHSESFIQKHPNQYIEIFIDLAKSPNAKYFPQLPFSQMYKREIKDAYLKVIRRELNPDEALKRLQIKMVSL